MVCLDNNHKSVICTGIISLMQCDWMLQLCLRIVLSAKPTELTGVVVLGVYS